MPFMETDTEPMMKRLRGNDDEQDRISHLPDCVLIHLMTFMRTGDAVRTCVLSTRWKCLWKRIPTLELCSWCGPISRLTYFDRFVTNVMSCRDSSVPLRNLEFSRHCTTPPHLLRRVVSYAVSHNTERLRINVSCGMDLPPCIFSCQTLTSLDLLGYKPGGPGLFPTSLSLPALTSLRIRSFAFSGDGNESVEPFSSCIKLKTLFVIDCVLRNPQVLYISNATLVNLTIALPWNNEDAYRAVLSTPNLCSFTFLGGIELQLSANNLSFLKDVNVDVDERGAPPRYAFVLISLLQVLASVRSLTVSSSTLQVLSIIPDLLNTKSPCLHNLKSLIVKVMKPRYQYQHRRRRAAAQLNPPSELPHRAVDFLIRNSPLAKVTIIDSQRYNMNGATCIYE